MPPKISIVTPSYNQAEYIEQTIDSVLSQAYPNVEYIVVDGGSTDGSAEIIRKYEKHLAYWVSEKDRGQSHAINKGMRRASGDILAYLNSDDYYLPGTFEAAAELAAAHPEAGLLHGRCRFVDAVGNPVGSQFGRFDTPEELLDVWGVWWSKRQVVQPEVFWTRAVYDKVGHFREDLNFIMDYDYWLRILLSGFTVARADREFTAFRFQPNQKSEHSEKVAEELLALIMPTLWDEGTAIDPDVRRSLKGNWLYHHKFRPRAEDAVQTSKPVWRRWLSLAAVVVQHPHLLYSAHLRQDRIAPLFRRAASTFAPRSA